MFFPKSNKPTLKEEDLSRFTGTEQYYRYNKLLLTDGAKHVADEGHAWWLFAVILSYQGHHKIRQEEMQCWKLKKKEDGTWTVYCTDGNYTVLVEQEVDATDFPINEVDIWIVDTVCMLPSEY